MSPSHSGSTLLSLLLGSQKNIFSAGELFLFSDRPEHLFQKKILPCSCNHKLKEECPFWQKVESYLINYHNLKLDELNVESNDSMELTEHNKYLIKALINVTGESIILDNSKVVSRFKQLTSAGFNVVPIVLKRDPCALVFSWMKRGHDWWKVARFYPDYYKEVCAAIKYGNPVSVKYEELTGNLSSSMEKLLKDLKMTADTFELDWTRQTTHYLKGNAVISQKNADIKISEEWKNALSLRQKIVIKILAFPTRFNQLWLYRFWSKLCRVLLWRLY